MFNIPNQITQGDRVIWHEELEGYSNTDTLALFIRGAFSLDLTGVANNNGWDFEINEATSSVLTPSLYKTQFVIYQGTGRKTLGGTDLMVCPSFESLATFDTRDDDQKELELITQAIAKLVSGAVSEYRVGDRTLRYQDLAQLTQRQRELRNRIAKIKNPGNRNVGITFGRD